MITRIKSPKEIETMREGGRMLARVLQLLANNIQAGATPRDMAQLAKTELKKLGGKPAFLGYQGYPDVICISVNHQVQHAIPTNIPFRDGDVVNFDFGVIYRGLVTDAGITVGLGPINGDNQRLIDGVKNALQAAIDNVKDGARVGDISSAIQGALDRARLGIVKDLVGHGVGDNLHEEPEIPNWGQANQGMVLKAGMTVAIEPIANLGLPQIRLENDGWTLSTADGSNSAQWEHTLVVTEQGAQVLTLP